MNKSLVYKSYQELIHSLQSNGYKCQSFETIDPQEKHFVLRHDIDQSISHAVTMANFEKGLGVNSYYFVLLRTEMYNVFSKSSISDLKKILELGHKIGLHLDCTFYKEDELETKANFECDVLSNLLGIQINAISFHRPHKSLLGKPEKVAGRFHTYMPQFFNDIGYCSDSAGAWNDFPLEHKKFQQGHALQILTHPIWWQKEDDISVQEKLNALISQRSEILKIELAQNVKTYKV